MPEGRFLSKAISQSVQLGSVSLEADYLFTRCIPHLDREGRIVGDPRLVKASVCPLRNEMSAELVELLLRQLAEVGLVRWYEVHGKQVLEFPGFRNHQRGMKLDREAASRFGSSDHPDAHPLCENNSGLTPDQRRTSAALSRSRSRSEVEVKDVEINLNGAVAPAVESPDVSIPPEPTTLGEFMAFIRKLGYEADARDASVLKAMLRKIKPHYIFMAIVGLPIIVKSGQYPAPAGQRLNMRMLYSRSKGGKMPAWVQAEDAYLAAENSKPSVSWASL